VAEIELSEYYRIVAWAACPWCIKAQSLLKDSGAEVHMMYYEQGTQELQEAKVQHDWMTVPMITHVSVCGDDVEETFVGGYDSLCKFIGKNGE
jgi:glutaredoxin